MEDEKETEKETPAPIAAKHGRTELMEGEKETEKETPAHIAAKHGRTEVLRSLMDIIDHNNVKGGSGGAITQLNYVLFQLLSSHKHSSGSSDTPKKSLVYIAAEEGHASCLDLIRKAITAYRIHEMMPKETGGINVKGIFDIIQKVENTTTFEKGEIKDIFSNSGKENFKKRITQSNETLREILENDGKDLAGESKKEIRSFFEEENQPNAEAAERTPGPIEKKIKNEISGYFKEKFKGGAETAGAIAIEKRNFEVVKLFLPPLCDKFGLLDTDLGEGNKDFLNMVIEAVKPLSDDHTGKASILKDLLGMPGINVNIKDLTQGFEGQTACIIAARNGDRESLAVLAEKGANPNIEDDGGKTALYYAVASGDQKSCEMLGSGTFKAVDNNRSQMQEIFGFVYREHKGDNSGAEEEKDQMQGTVISRNYIARVRVKLKNIETSAIFEANMGSAKRVVLF